MKITINSKYVKWGLTAFAVIAASISFAYLIFHTDTLMNTAGSYAQMLMPVLFGFGIAYLMTPILNFIERRILFALAHKCRIRETAKMRALIRSVGILLTSCLVLAIVYAVCSMLISQIVPSISNIVYNADTYITNVRSWLYGMLKDNPAIAESVASMFEQYSGELETWLNGTLLANVTSLLKSFSLSLFNTIGVLWEFIIGFIIAIYVLAAKETFAGQAKKVVYAVFQNETANTVIRNFRFTHKTFIGFLSGKVLDSLIIGILCFIGTTILKTPYAALVSLVVGVTNIIPFFGPFIGAVPCSILIFVINPMQPLNCLYFVIFVFLLQQFDGNILGPKILGDSTGLTGFWVIFAITLFGGVFGIPGMIVGVPVFAVIYAGLKSLVHQSLKKKNLSQQTREYISVDFVDKDGVFHQIPQKNKKA
ncbi:MAG: AI-2E family transporter [Clostridia bacterium]|nr:AI-2E family transporter [Clostridia bacterium]